MTTRINFNGQEYASIEAMPPAVRTAYLEALAQHGLSNAVAGDSGTVARARAVFGRAHSEDFLRAHYRAKHAAARILPILVALVAGVVIPGGAWLLWHLDAGLRSQGGGFQVGRGLLLTVALTGMVGIGLAITMMTMKQGSPEAGTPRSSNPDHHIPPSRTEPNETLLGALDSTEHTLARVLQILLGVAAGCVVAAGVWMISRMDASSTSQAGDIFVGIGVLVALAGIAGMYISIEMRLKK